MTDQKRVITDTDELIPLPLYTVTREHPHGIVYEKWNDGWHGLGLIDEPTNPRLPVTVLYNPEDSE